MAKTFQFLFQNSTGVHNLAFIYELSRCSVRDLSALLDIFKFGAPAPLAISRLDQFDIYGFMQKFVCSQARMLAPFFFGWPTHVLGFWWS